MQSKAAPQHDEGQVGQDADDALVGLLQITCAVRIPLSSAAESAAHADGMRGGLSPETMRQISATIQGIFEVPDFEVLAVVEAGGENPPWVPDHPSHTWLGSRSRHVAVQLQRCFYDASAGFPGPLDFRTVAAEDSPWISYRRVQVAVDQHGNPLRDNETGAADPENLDATDYLIRARITETAMNSRPGKDTASADMPIAILESMQSFLADLYAQRKQDNFAAHLSERVYHIWLPPGRLTPEPEGDHEVAVVSGRGLGEFAILPFVTLVRLPEGSAFRRSIAANIVLIPLPLPGHGKSAVREFGDEEILSLFQMIIHPTSTQTSRTAMLRYRLRGPLVRYLDQLCTVAAGRPLCADAWSEARKHTAPASVNSDRPPGGLDGADATLRQWMELVAAAAAERGVVVGERPWRSRRELADTVLAALRMNSAWLVSVLHSRIPPVAEWWQHPDGLWGPDTGQLPVKITTLLDNLMLQLRPAKRRLSSQPHLFPIGIFTRIDSAQSMEGSASALIWHIPGRRGIVSAYPRSSEQFPGRSTLNLFGVLAHMLIGASCAMDMMNALPREAVLQSDTRRRARGAHDLLVELEDVFDLDLAYEPYRVMWRRLLTAFGLDAHYRMVLERVELLSRYAEVEEREQTALERNRRHDFETTVTIGAATLGLGVLILSDAALFAASDRIHAWIIALTAAVTILMISGFLILYRRTEDRSQETTPARREIRRNPTRAGMLTRNRLSKSKGISGQLMSADNLDR